MTVPVGARAVNVTGWSLREITARLHQEYLRWLCEDKAMTWDAETVAGLTIGILGGTGDQGRGLAYRFARAGHRVVIGSRSSERGQAAATEIAKLAGVVGDISGGTNADACQAADLVIVAVP